LKLFVFTAVVLLSGCTSLQHIDMSVNALSARDASPSANSSYVLVPGQADVALGDLQFQEFSRYVERVLSTHGMQRTFDREKAQTVVTLSYGIGDPQVFTQQISVPVFGQTGISSLNTTGQVVGNTFKSTTTVTPTYGITGYSQSTSSQTFFMRNMKLTAFKKEEVVRGSFNQLWMVSVASAGPTADLRLVFPYLATAAGPYIGKSPGRIVSVRLNRNDQQVAAITAQ
jgi:hypothetical protein